MNAVVLAKPEDTGGPRRELDPALERALVKEAPQKMQEEAGERPVVAIEGRTYTAIPIDQFVLDSIEDDEEFDRALEYERQNS
jgi:hypothetical protein